jgi:uncharacterized membrane protein YdcZ (DUF606 family)
MVWLYLLVCLLAGALMPLQAGVNAQLARWVGHPVTASLVSVLLDHFGALGFAARPVTPLRLLGALLLVGGVLLVRKF